MNKKMELSNDIPIGGIIAKLYRQFQIYINKALADLNISSSEYNYLVVLYHQDAISQECLSARTFINKAATARAIKSLEEKGYVTRTKEENDKRTNKVCITEKAIFVKSRVISALDQWDQMITCDLDKETVIEMTNTLRNITNRIINTQF